MSVMDLALQKAKEAAGGTVALARLLTSVGKPITYQAITQWDRVPAQRARDVERVTGVPRHELRPDLWANDGGAQ